MIMNVGLSDVRSSAADRGRRQQGFTLIELSIVLTIIGLIVGGILKGQELINNARIKSQVAQIDNIKSAIFTFQDRYNALPGDYLTPSNLGWASGTSLGDGNGFIGSLGTGSGSTAVAAAAITDSASVASTEAVAVWPELTAANLVGGFILTASVTSGTASITSITSLGTVASTGYLPAKLASSDQLWLATFTVTPPGGSAQTNLMLRIDASTDGTAADSVKRSDMISLDTKYDDGLPATGSIIVGAKSTSDCAASSAWATTTTNTSTSTCSPFFVIQ